MSLALWGAGCGKSEAPAPAARHGGAETVTAAAGRASVFALEPQAEVFARYGGSASCRDCHEEAYELWETSNHGLAERPVSEAMDAPAFHEPSTFRHGTQETTVVWTNAAAAVWSFGLTGGAELHRIDRVIGNDPIRQFLVPFPGGRWQTLEATYDPLTNEWFNVYGDEDRRAGEWGHWTGRGMNWNHMCAGCHNTRLRKNYEVGTDAYHTAMAEMSVGCEACHGPLKAHNEWQQVHGKSGLTDPTVGKLERSRVLEYCGFCHARRSDLTGDFVPGERFADHQELVIVDRTDRYYPDGQVRDEDYEYASFLSSRMHLRGVMCLDCHDPHSVKTRLPGNWLCIRCHNGSYTNAPIIDPVAHSRHKVFGFDTNGTAVAFDLTEYDPKRITETGGECVNCHMPQTVYMGRDWRHDHGFTIPDPLLTQQFGIPNACNRCHQDKTVEWALEACDQWYSNRMDRVTRTRAQWLSRAKRDDPAARDPVLKMLAEEELGYWRAVAVEFLLPWIGQPAVNAALLKAAHDEDPLVRTKTLRALELLLEGPAAVGARQTLRKALEDPIRSVRVQAAWVLRADLPADTLAGSELRHYLDLNADQPGGQMQLAAWALARGNLEQAAGHYRTALAWDPNSAPIYHDYAVVLSMLNRSQEAIAQLQTAARLAPQEAEYRYKLGLAWNEVGDLAQALGALQEAVRLNPGHARAGYNLGLALNQMGRASEALEALARAEQADPSDPRIPYAAATILAQAGRRDEARGAAARAARAAPDWDQARQLLDLLSRP